MLHHLPSSIAATYFYGGFLPALKVLSHFPILTTFVSKCSLEEEVYKATALHHVSKNVSLPMIFDPLDSELCWSWNREYHP